MSTRTHQRDDAVSRRYRTRWFMPSFSLLLGAVMLGAFWIGGDLGQGLFSLGVMAFVAALFYFGARRSETLAPRARTAVRTPSSVQSPASLTSPRSRCCAGAPS
jgi:hypothetical protein